MRYKFNNKCREPYFLKKVSIAEYMLKNFIHVKTFSSTSFEKSILVKDPKRNVYIMVYIGKKCKGFGKGITNRVNLNFHCPENKNIHYAFLTKQDLNVYQNEMNEFSNIDK